MPAQLVKRSAKLLSNLLADVVGVEQTRWWRSSCLSFQPRGLKPLSSYWESVIERWTLCPPAAKTESSGLSKIRDPLSTHDASVGDVTAPHIPYLAGHVTAGHAYSLNIKPWNIVILQGALSQMDPFHSITTMDWLITTWISFNWPSSTGGSFPRRAIGVAVGKVKSI